MYYPSDQMKVNTFRQVRIPSNAEYFARYGYAVSPESGYSGDNVVSDVGDKLLSAREAERSLLMEMRDAEIKKQQKSD